MCPRVKKLSSEEVLCLTITQSSFQLSNVAVQKIMIRLRIVRGVLLLSFRFQFDSKNLFQSKLSLVSWTSLRVAHNVQCMCRSGAYEAAPCPTHPNEIMKLKLQCNTVPRYGTCTLLWPVPSPLSCLWKSEPSLKSSVPTFILLRAGRKCFVAHWLVRVAVFPCTFSLFIFSIVLAVHWSGKKMSCCLLTCLRCSFPSSPFLFLFCQSSSLSNGAGQKIFCYLLTCPRCSFSFPLFPFPFLFFQSSLLSNGAGRKIFC